MIYTNDFESYPAGTYDLLPDDWTALYVTPFRWRVEGDAGSRYAALRTGSPGTSVLVWDDVDADADKDNTRQEIVFTHTGSTTNFIAALTTRANPAEKTHLTVYLTVTNIVFSVWNAGTETEITSLAHGIADLTIGTYVLELIDLNGTIQARVYENGTQPPAFQIDEAHALAAGTVGIWGPSVTSDLQVQTYEVETDYLQTATDPLVTVYEDAAKTVPAQGVYVQFFEVDAIDAEALALSAISYLGASTTTDVNGVATTATVPTEGKVVGAIILNSDYDAGRDEGEEWHFAQHIVLGSENVDLTAPA